MTHTRRAFISIVGAFAIGIGSVVRVGEADQKPHKPEPIYRTEHVFTTGGGVFVGRAVGGSTVQRQMAPFAYRIEFDIPKDQQASVIRPGDCVYSSQRTEVSYDNGNTWVETDQEHVPRKT